MMQAKKQKVHFLSNILRCVIYQPPQKQQLLGCLDCLCMCLHGQKVHLMVQFKYEDDAFIRITDVCLSP